jgi:hypothetical protein
MDSKHSTVSLRGDFLKMANEELVVLGKDALAKGGLGFDAGVFQLRPAFLKLLQPMNLLGQPAGTLLDTESKNTFTDIQVVLMNKPAQARKKYFPGNNFTRDSVQCFSTDMIVPHASAKDKQAMDCAHCQHSSWDKWRQTRSKTDLPACKEYWTLSFVERTTRMPYKMNVEGGSISTFKEGMAQLARMGAMLLANVKQENLKITEENKTLPADQQKPLKPAPSIFDISFHIYVIAPQPGDSNRNYRLGFKDFRSLKPEDREEFGSLFLQYVNRFQQQANATPDPSEEEILGAEQANGAPAATTVIPTPQGVVLPSTGAAPVEGVVLPPTGQGQQKSDIVI